MEQQGFPDQSSGPVDSKGRFHLSSEQLQHLMNKISSDEQKELQETLASCTKEVTLSRGLPISAAIVGSLYFARTRLPAQYHFGPKGWPFYAMMGIASMTATNLMFMGMCRDRAQPKLAQLWNKYCNSDGGTTYNALRERNRAGIHEEPRLSRQPTDSWNPTNSPSNRGYDQIPPISSRNANVYGNPSEGEGTYGAMLRRPSYDIPPTLEPTMSGTPSDSAGTKNNDLGKLSFS